MIRAGSLRHRITIQEATLTQDAHGQPIASWGTLAGGRNLPARVDSVEGGERIRGRQVAAEATTLFTTRYLRGITPQMRVTYQGRTLPIVRVSDPDGKRLELRIECKELVE
jgi:SPP1 family predicted phage head-tail adaptor